MDRPGDSGRIESDDPAYVTVFSGLVERTSSAAPAVVVAPATNLRGFVVDAQGVPIEGAKIEVHCPEEMRTHIPANLDASEARSWSEVSGGQGDYAFAALPRIPDARLECTHEGFVPFQVALADALGGQFMITLVRPDAREAAVRGRVVDKDGAPVENAWVALGIETTKSDEHGFFASKLDDPKGRNAQFHVPADRLVATCRGYLPAELHAPMVGGRPAWPAHVTLKLGEDALSISGTVTDHRGELRAGVKVFVTDTEVFGEVDGRPAQLENVIRGDTDRVWSYVETDADGRFRVDGLCARAYTIRALEPDTLLRADVRDVEAGTSGLSISMPRDGLYPRVAGTVRTHDGKPVAGARVFPMCDAFQARLNGSVVSTSHDALDGVATDAEGRFSIPDVPKSLVYLRVEREDILPLEYGRWVEGDERYVDALHELPKDRIDSLDIRVDRRAHVQVELADPSFADEFALLDEKGVPLEVSVFVGKGRREGRRSPIVEGKSYVTAGTNRAKAIVLYASGKEAGRRSVSLVAGQTTTIRW
jgi:protocatechuate 3,4-dioxygenase beta subunit